MPKETRFLTFETSELYQAIYEFARRTGRISVPGEISEISFTRADPLQLNVRFHNVMATLSLDAEEIGAILIFYCIDRRVPLPRDAKKTVSVRDNKIELVVFISPTRAAAASQ